MDKDQRIQQLLEANNKLVEAKRKLRIQLGKDRAHFKIMADNADESTKVKIETVWHTHLRDIDQVLQNTSAS